MAVLCFARLFLRPLVSPLVGLCCATGAGGGLWLAARHARTAEGLRAAAREQAVLAGAWAALATETDQARFEAAARALALRETQSAAPDHAAWRYAGAALCESEK